MPGFTAGHSRQTASHLARCSRPAPSTAAGLPPRCRAPVPIPPTKASSSEGCRRSANGHADGGHRGTAGVRLGLEWRREVGIIDLDLPRLSGLEVARRLRDGLGEAVRLIALTGLTQAENRV